MSAYFSESIVNALLKMGATCFLPKHCDFSILLDAITSVHNKGFYSMEESEKQKRINLELEMNEKFTPREIDILKLLCKEKTSKEIAKDYLLVVELWRDISCALWKKRIKQVPLEWFCLFLGKAILGAIG